MDSLDLLFFIFCIDHKQNATQLFLKWNLTDLDSVFLLDWLPY